MSQRNASPLDDSVGYWVHRLHRAMNSAFQRRLLALGVTPPEWTVLVHCSLGIASPAELAERIDIDRAAISRLLDQMEGKGLIAQEPHPSDGRCTLVGLTPVGRDLVPKLVSQSREVNQQFLRHLSKEERAELLTSLKKVIGELPRSTYPSC